MASSGTPRQIQLSSTGAGGTLTVPAGDLASCINAFAIPASGAPFVLTNASYSSGVLNVTVSSTTGLTPGMNVVSANTGFPTGAVISSITNITTFVMSAAPGSSVSGATIYAGGQPDNFIYLRCLGKNMSGGFQGQYKVTTGKSLFVTSFFIGSTIPVLAGYCDAPGDANDRSTVAPVNPVYFGKNAFDYLTAASAIIFGPIPSDKYFFVRTSSLLPLTGGTAGTLFQIVGYEV